MMTSPVFIYDLLGDEECARQCKGHDSWPQVTHGSLARLRVARSAGRGFVE